MPYTGPAKLLAQNGDVLTDDAFVEVVESGSGVWRGMIIVPAGETFALMDAIRETKGVIEFPGGIKAEVAVTQCGHQYNSREQAAPFQGWGPMPGSF